MIGLIAAAVAASARGEPMLDGNCADHAGIARPLIATDGVRAFVRETRQHVWVCFAVPVGSYASVDLRVDAPGLSEPVNLHASAQLGEWPATSGGAAPADASSSAWWRVSGWWASTTPFNGSVSAPEGRRINFRTVKGREFQLSKQRFGSGLWKLEAVIADVAGGAGQSRSVRWPTSGSYDFTVE